MYVEENIIIYLIALSSLLYSINCEIYSLIILIFIAYILYFHNKTIIKNKDYVNDNKLQKVFNQLKEYKFFNKKKYYNSIKKINKFLTLINQNNLDSDIVYAEILRDTCLNDLSSIIFNVSGNNINVIENINKNINSIKKITDEYLQNIKEQVNHDTFNDPSNNKNIFSINSPEAFDKNYFKKYELY